jgi:hypothetical protein
MEKSEAIPGRWIEIYGVRCLVIGIARDNAPVVEYADTTIRRISNWSVWTLLPAECDSFDWQPETFPQWYEAQHAVSGTVAAERISATEVIIHKQDGRKIKRKWLPSDKSRNRITDAQALALLDKPAEPVESPDDWVPQDRVPARPTDERRWVHIATGTVDLAIYNWMPVSEAGTTHGTHGFVNESRTHRLELRCLRKDLPPLPEHVKPATRKVVLTEWLIEHIDGNATIHWMLQRPWISSTEILTAIGTREIEIPLPLPEKIPTCK